MSKIISTATIILFGLCGCTFQNENISETANANVSLGVAYLQQGEREKARMALNQAIAASRGSSSAWSAMAYLEELCGNLTLADEDYRRAIRLAPDSGESHNNYGAFLCRHDQPKSGIQEFLTAVQLPNYITRAAAYENAARCAQIIPDPKAAAFYSKAAQQNNPSFTILY